MGNSFFGRAGLRLVYIGLVGAGLGVTLNLAHAQTASSAVATATSDVVASKVKRPVQRIITLSPHSAEMLFAIGQGDKIVGTTRFTDYPEAAKKIPIVGGYIGLYIEQIIQLEPDVIISWRSGNPARELNQLTDLGFTLIDSDAQTLAGVADTILMLGELTGAQTQASAVAHDYLAQLDQAEKKYQEATKVKVFYQLWPNPLRTVAKGSWVQQYIEVCGGEIRFMIMMRNIR